MKISELLTDESKWTRGTFARDVSGKSVMPRETSAVSFCLAGACYACYRADEAADALDKLRAALGHDELAVFNDSGATTFQQIRELVLKADV